MLNSGIIGLYISTVFNCLFMILCIVENPQDPKSLLERSGVTVAFVQQP
jgi:hypothetical protein